MTTTLSMPALCLMLATALLASDPPPKDLKSLGESRHRSAAYTLSSGLDEQALRLEALFQGKELSPFVEYKNVTSHDQTLTLVSFSIAGQGEVVVADGQGLLTVLPTEREGVQVKPGDSVHFAFQGEHHSGFANVCFSVTDDRGAGHYAAFWFQPLAAGRPRMVELPGMGKPALGLALQNWTRRQLAAKAPASK